MTYAVVVPTLGRESLRDCLSSLADAAGPPPERLVLVDDRPGAPHPLDVRVPGRLAGRCDVVTLGGRGPAAARNAGWRAAAAVSPVEWIVFLDDDVVVGPHWRTDLAADLEAPAGVGGVAGRVVVPPPAGRPADGERSTLGLATARWITADMAYRRAALLRVGGFDERFRRAFREDADLALRVRDAGWTLRQGDRLTTHPVRPVSRWISLRQQAGNADDALMARVHGRGWHRRAGAPVGRFPAHVLTCALGLAALAGAATRRRRLAAASSAGWLLMTCQFAWSRIRRGPLERGEVAAMALTSVAVPPLAVGYRLRGRRRYRHAEPWPPRPKAVLFDRDGILVRDAPYNDDPEKVEPMPGAAAAVELLRAAGLRVGVLTNQSGVGRGLLSAGRVAAVNRRVDEVFSGFDTWAVCLHAPSDGCDCRKPAPGLVRRAAADLGLDPCECVVVGDIGADMDAARAAGTRGLLVPTEATLRDELAGEWTAPDLLTAVHRILGVTKKGFT